MNFESDKKAILEKIEETISGSRLLAKSATPRVMDWLNKKIETKEDIDNLAIMILGIMM